MRRRIRVEVVDDEPELLSSTRKIIDAEPDLAVVATATSAPEALALARSLRPEVVTVDLGTTEGSEAVARVLAGVEPGVAAPAVLALAPDAGEETALDLLRAGASGVCARGDTPEVLVHSVRSVAAGSAVVSSPVLGALLARERRSRPLELEPCSSRELEVLDLVARGASNPEIAGELYISEATVRSHLRSLRLKLDARDRVGLVVVAHRSGLV